MVRSMSNHRLPLHMKRLTFAELPVGSEFYWGSNSLDRMNWGKKRSSRTADFRPRIGGKLSDYSAISYWTKTEIVYMR